MPRSKIFAEKFASEYENLDNSTKIRVDKVIQKILDKPYLGKPLMYSLSGLRSERVGPFRIIYEEKDNVVIFRFFDHRKKVYGR